MNSTIETEPNIRRIPGEEVKIGEEEYTCCEVCGNTIMSWRYKDHSLNDENGKPKPRVVEWIDDVTGGKRSYTKYSDDPTEGYFTCHQQAKSKKAVRDITVYKRGWTEVRCCGEWLQCTRFTNTCDNCGADYNMSGQCLAPREQWGEETGEHWSDCYEGSLED